jgi:hypothetical protein
MHGRCLLILALCLGFLSCSDLSTEPTSIDGTYRGTFTLTHGSGLVESGVVTISFLRGQYTCSPEQKYLPPSGSGLYVIVDDTIRLTDTALHTAEFDWTLILNGSFSFRLDGSHVVLSQQDSEHQRHRRIDLSRQ